MPVRTRWLSSPASRTPRSDVSIHPTLLHGCASAATAAEARFRIDAPVDIRREARVIALDAGAADVTEQVAHLPWSGAVFLTIGGSGDMSGNGYGRDPVLRTSEGTDMGLTEVLDGADLAVMVATLDAGVDLAAAIGEACARRRIMTAGIVIDTEHRLDAAVRALRPHAQVLLVSSDDDDLVEILTALRA